MYIIHHIHTDCMLAQKPRMINLWHCSHKIGRIISLVWWKNVALDCNSVVHDCTKWVSEPYTYSAEEFILPYKRAPVALSPHGDVGLGSSIDPHLLLSLARNYTHHTLIFWKSTKFADIRRFTVFFFIKWRPKFGKKKIMELLPPWPWKWS